jgi:four helix bundle protein
MASKSEDLEKRTLKLSGEVILLCKKVPGTPINAPIISQLVRSVTSIGANYAEANGASSRGDFKNKIYICKKECLETKYWLQVLAEANVEVKEEGRVLWKEIHELTLIFSKIIGSLNSK